MVVIKRLGHAVEMSYRGQDDKHVKYLMGVAPDVKCAGIAPFWPASLCEYKVSQLLLLRLSS